MKKKEYPVSAIRDLWSRIPEKRHEEEIVDLDDISLSDYIIREVGSLQVVIARQEEEIARLKAELADFEFKSLHESDIKVPLFKKSFFRELDRMISFSHRYDDPASFGLIKIQNYNELLSEFGPGVMVMAELDFGRYLASSIRRSDMVGNLEDGSYGLLFHHSKDDDVKTRLNCLALRGQSESFSYGDHQLQLSLLSSITEVKIEDTPTRLIERATQKLAS